MRLLPYCITETEPRIEVPSAGVQGKPVEVIVDSGLRCLLSRYSETTTPSHQSLAHPIRETAMEFHRVLQQVFRQVAIIPFRFPTVLADDAELAAFLREHREEYLRDLPRLRDKVQMEIRVTYQKAPHSQSSSGKSGLDYMREHQAQLQVLGSAVSLLRSAGQPWMECWSERQVPSGVRCYALIPRQDMQLFVKAIGDVEIPGDLTARVTGPWPATEFLGEH